MEKTERIGKIYKVVNTVNDKVYIGSTQLQYLSKRMGHHRENCLKIPNVGKLYPAMIELGIEKFKIVLLETMVFTDKEELKAREYELIKQFNTVENGYNSMYKDGFLIGDSKTRHAKACINSFKNGVRKNDNIGITRRKEIRHGKEFFRWCAYYNPTIGTSKTVSFSETVYGEEGAKQKAIEWRNEMIKDLDKYN
jgi:group I intron endonuclease